MGYCMAQRDSKFSMTAESAKKALKEIKSLAGSESVKDGGGRHYSWVVTEDFLKAETFSEAMRAWRWEVEEGKSKTGTVVAVSFEGEKLGDDATLFKAIAPYVEAGSWIEMEGEDGCLWRWVFDGKTVEEKSGRVVFD